LFCTNERRSFLGTRALILIKDAPSQNYQEVTMFAFCREVQNFVSVCEELQFLLMQGRALTPDEKGVVEFSAKNLLDNLDVLTCQRSSR